MCEPAECPATDVRAQRADFGALAQRGRQQSGDFEAAVHAELDRLDAHVAAQLDSTARSLAKATPRKPTRDGWIALADERAGRIVALSRFIGLHRQGFDSLLQAHGRLLERIATRLEQPQSFWRQRLQIRPLLDQLGALYHRGGHYSAPPPDEGEGGAAGGAGSNVQDGENFRRKTRKFWVPAGTENEVMT